MERKPFQERDLVTNATQTLAWLMAQGDDIIPIPGTKRVKYFDENMGALKIQLTKEEEAEVRKAVEAAETHGARYPEAYVPLPTLPSKPFAEC